MGFQTDRAGSRQTIRDMETMKFSTRQINRNFKIKVNGTFEGKKVNTLVGVAGFIKMVGDLALVERLLDRAFDSTDDKVVCKLRRGIKFTFYYI